MSIDANPVPTVANAGRSRAPKAPPGGPRQLLTIKVGWIYRGYRTNSYNPPRRVLCVRDGAVYWRRCYSHGQIHPSALLERTLLPAFEDWAYAEEQYL